MMNKLTKLQKGIGVLIILHIVGLIGLLGPYKEQFVLLTPFNLIVSCIILILFQKERTNWFWAIMIFIMIMGYAIEVIGVNTGYPFGIYEYGPPFGIQWMGTPFLIGVNWFIMAFCGATIAKSFSKNIYLNSFLSGILITLFDIILEPVAIAYNFWTWEAESVPIQNYITWTISIALFSILIYKILPDSQNPMAKWVLGIQTVFFLIILLSISL